VVLRLAPPITNREQATVPESRATVARIYQQITEDLQQAVNLLPAQNGNFANKNAAKAILARVYFNMADYANAYKWADDVIKNSGATLGNPSDLNTVKMPFNVSGNTALPTGVLFQIVSEPSRDKSGLLRGNLWNTNEKTVPLPITATLSSLLKTRGGIRYEALYLPGASAQPYTQKYALLQSAPVNIPYIRLAEMYLTRAEAGLQANAYTVNAARADLNAVRAIAQAPFDNSTSDRNAMIAVIQAERRIELAMEGDRYHELRRLKQDIRGIAFNDKKGLLKLPDSEMRGNPSLEQN
jgi:hypothetical protein